MGGVRSELLQTLETSTRAGTYNKAYNRHYWRFRLVLPIATASTLFQ